MRPAVRPILKYRFSAYVAEKMKRILKRIKRILRSLKITLNLRLRHYQELLFLQRGQGPACFFRRLTILWRDRSRWDHSSFLDVQIFLSCCTHDYSDALLGLESPTVSYQSLAGRGRAEGGHQKRDRTV